MPYSNVSFYWEGVHTVGPKKNVKKIVIELLKIIVKDTPNVDIKTLQTIYLSLRNIIVLLGYEIKLRGLTDIGSKM